MMGRDHNITIVRVLEKDLPVSLSPKHYTPMVYESIGPVLGCSKISGVPSRYPEDMEEYVRRV